MRMTSTDDLLARHRAVMPSWMPLYYAEPLEIVSGSGRRVTCSDGRTYLDFFGGVLTTMVGYDIPEIREAVRAAAAHRGGAHLDALPDPRAGRAGREDRPVVRHSGRPGVLHQLGHRGQRGGPADGHQPSAVQPDPGGAQQLPRPVVRGDGHHRPPQLVVVLAQPAAGQLAALRRPAARPAVPARRRRAGRRGRRRPARGARDADRRRRGRADRRAGAGRRRLRGRRPTGCSAR